MKFSSLLLVISLASAGCGHTMRVRLPPPDARGCKASGHRIGVGPVTIAEPTGKSDAICIERNRYGRPGFAAQVRATLVSDLAATGCFQDVLDLQASPSAEVDYVLTGNIASLNGCTRDASEEGASGASSLSGPRWGSPAPA